MKKVIVWVAIIALVIVGVCYSCVVWQNKHSVSFQIYDTKDMTAEILQNRTSNVIVVERCIGIVTNAERGDGKILNTDDDYYNYISYKSIDGVNEGDIVLTYLIYNPNNNAIDDIIERYDYILAHNTSGF